MVLTRGLLVAATLSALASCATRHGARHPGRPAAAEEARFDAMARTHLSQFRDLTLAQGREFTLLEHRALTLGGLRALLAGAFGPDTAVLVYAYREDAPILDAWLVGADGIRASASTRIGMDDLAGAIATFQRSIGAGARAPRARGAKPVVAPADRAGAAASLDRLRRMLLPAAIAAKLGPVRELLVAPTLGIGAVPFAALDVDGEPLIEKRTVTVVPNLFGLGAVDPAARPGPLQPAVVVGDPDLSGDPKWDFDPLEGARDEAAFAANATGAKALVGKAATREAVRHALAGPSRVQLLYFATHGVAFPDRPLEGFLALSGAHGVDPWTASEIEHERVRARLAVLSACQTGVGLPHGGGVVGLARAFQLAGVRNVVMSLWNVPDVPTVVLMRDFLEGALGPLGADGRRDRAEMKGSPAEALRCAMRTARKRDPGSLNWAAFALFATPSGRREAGFAQGGARLVLDDAAGSVTRDGGRVPVGGRVLVRVEGDRDAPPRSYRYLVTVDAEGEADIQRGLHLELAPRPGMETLLLVEADRPLGDDHLGAAEPAVSPVALPRTLAGLAALFPLDDPAVRLRILQLQVELVPSPVPPR